MKELIERIERATGPDRELDIAILTTVLGYRDIHSDGTLFDRGNDGYWNTDTLPSPTGSFDAAMELVPDGATVLCGIRQTPETIPWARVGQWHCHDATGANLALALCAATLKAIDAKQ